jgi:hypothetical protein
MKTGRRWNYAGGEQFVWSNGNPLGGQQNLRIQAKNLGPITM